MKKYIKPQYIKDDRESIFTQLRKDIDNYLRNAEPAYQSTTILKAILFPSLYLFIYLVALNWGTHHVVLYTCYFLLGLLLVIIFLNVIHDAVHSAIFRSKKLNKVFVYFFDLMGANSYIWQIRHVRFHHNYPNVNGWDTDLEQSDLVRVFPDGKFSRLHRFQHIYLPLLYPFYLANWLFVRDFKDFFNKNRTVRKLIAIPPVEYVKLFVFKVLFVFFMIILPKLLLGLTWMAITVAFLVMLFTASCFSLLVLLSPHANIHSAFPIVKENKLQDSWMMHMMRTTNDITNDNWFIRFFMGCFNYHVAHHLFPNVSHVHYPEITKLLKKYVEKYDLPYREFSLWTSLKNHYLLLKQNRKPQNIFEETM